MSKSGWHPTACGPVEHDKLEIFADRLHLFCILLSRFNFYHRHGVARQMRKLLDARRGARRSGNAF